MILSVLIITLLFTGFFTGIEIAFISANKLGIELKKKQGKRSGMILSYFLDNPSRFIGTTLIGFNIFFVAYGLTITDFLQPFWNLTGISELDKTGSLKLIIEVILSTLVVLLVVFFFKAVFRAKNDSILAGFARLMEFFYSLFNPISSFFVSISSWLLKYIFNVELDDRKRPFNRVDLEHYFQQTIDVDDDNPELNQELFENALSLPGVKVRSCLVPRKEIVAVELNTPIEKVVEKMVETMLSKLVVYEGNIDNIVGYVHQLDMFRYAETLHNILLPIPAVPESMSVTDLIGKFSKERKSIAWVVDEFGGTAGIVTMEDLLEEIFGEIQDEYDTEEFIEKQLAESEYLFSGRLELDYLTEKYGLYFEDDESDTLSGYVIQQHESFPKQGDRIIAGDYQFDVMEMSDTRIELLKMKLLK
ncbi:MAG: hemolysin family protein [Bacteroidota bacterium]